MDENTGMGTPQPPLPPPGPREYVVEPERKRPVFVIVLGVLMMIFGFFTVAGTLVQPWLKDLQEKQMAKMPAEQRAAAEKQMEQYAGMQEYQEKLKPVSIVLGIAHLVCGLGLVMVREWGRISSIALFILLGAWTLVQMLFIETPKPPSHALQTAGQVFQIVYLAIVLVLAYYLTAVAPAFRPEEASATPAARA
jgi:hypothetical protein